MFFSGRLSRRAYARGAVIRIALFVVVTIAYPFALAAYVKSSGCGNDTCGALSLVVSLVVKPVIYLVFVLSFIGITIRRVRDVGVPAALAAIVPVLMLGDLATATAYGAPWSVGFVLGGMRPLFHYLLMALACVGFLCFVRSSDDPELPAGPRWGMAAALAFGIVTMTSIVAALSFVQQLAIWIGGVHVSKFFLYMMMYYSTIGTPLLLLALLAFVIWHQRGPRPV